MTVFKKVPFHTLVYTVDDVGPLTRRFYDGDLAALFDEWPTRKPGSLEENVSFEDMSFIGHIGHVTVRENNEIHFYVVVDVVGREELAWLLERLQIAAQFQRIAPWQPPSLRTKLVISFILAALVVLLLVVLGVSFGIFVVFVKGLAWLFS